MLNDLISIVLGVGVSAIILLLVILNVKLRIQVGKLVGDSKLSIAEKEMLLKSLDSLKDELETLKLEESDGFVKFLSESREWAFSYIDEVQLAIKDLKSAMDASDSQKVVEEFSRLVKFLPKEEETKGEING